MLILFPSHDRASSNNAQLVIRGGNYTHALQLKDSYNGTGQNADDLYYARLNGGYTQESKLTLFTSQSVGGLSAGATSIIGTSTSSLSGKVGIGTTTPTQPLDVKGNAIIAGATPSAPVGSGATLEVYENGSTANLVIHQDDSSASSTFSQIRFRNGGNDTYLKVPTSGPGVVDVFK